MRVPVTGSTGFVGGHVVRALSNCGYELGLLVRDIEKVGGLKGPNNVFLEGDLDDIRSLKQLLQQTR